MKTNSLLSVIVYSMSLVLFLNSNSLFVMWLVMEINLVSFSLMLYNFMDSSSKQGMISSCLYYFFIQSLGSVIFLMSSILSYNLLDISEYFLCLSLSLKLSIFPFFFWLYKISQFIGIYMFILLISIQKIPLLFFCYSMGSYFYITFFLSTIFGSFFLISSNNFLFLMSSSSIYSSFWVLFLFQMNSFSLLFFFCVYTLMLIQMGHDIYNKCSFSLYSIFLLKMLFLFLFFVGLPPFSIFFFKIFISYTIFVSWSMLDFFVFWCFSFLALFGYLKIFYKSFLGHVVHYLNNEKVFKKKSFFYFNGCNFLLFSIFWGKLC